MDGGDVTSRRGQIIPADGVLNEIMGEVDKLSRGR